MNKYLVLILPFVIAGYATTHQEEQSVAANIQDVSTARKSSGSVVEIIRYNLPQEKAKDFAAIYREVSKYLAASPHCRGYQVLHGVEEANRFIIVIEWDSIAGHEQGFTNSADFPNFITPLRPYLQYIEEMKHYEKTDVAWTP